MRYQPPHLAGKVNTRLALAFIAFAIAIGAGMFTFFEHPQSLNTAIVKKDRSKAGSSRSDPDTTRFTGGVNQHPNKNKRSTPKSTSKFSSLTPTAQSDNIQHRLSTLRNDLDNSTNPEIIIADFLRDIELMDSLQKRAFCGTMEDELAELSKDSKNRLEWLGSIFPKISTILKSNMVYNRTSKNHVFSLLAHNLEMLKIDPYEEIMKLPAGPPRQEFIEGLLPQYVISKAEDFRSLEARIPSESIPHFHQNIMEESAVSGVYITQALGLFLEGKGTEGEHPELVSRWFSDKTWLNENLIQLRDLVSKSEAGGRRDLVVMNVIQHTVDPEESSKWADLISDKRKLQVLRTEIKH